MEKKKKGLLIFSIIILIGIISIWISKESNKNSELNGDYYVYFKFPNKNFYIGETKYNTLYHFKDGLIKTTDDYGMEDEYLSYEVIDKDNLEFIGKTNGGSIRRDKVKIIRENDKIKKLYWVTTGNKLDELVEELFIKEDNKINPVPNLRNVSEIYQNSNFIGQQITIRGEIGIDNINNTEKNNYGLLFQSGDHSKGIFTDIKSLKIDDVNKLKDCYENHECYVILKGEIITNSVEFTKRLSPLCLKVTELIQQKPIILSN